jgi:hypothetical protein
MSKSRYYLNLLENKYFPVHIRMANGTPNWQIADELCLSEAEVVQLQGEELSPARLKRLWSLFCWQTERFRLAIGQDQMPWDDDWDEEAATW